MDKSISSDVCLENLRKACKEKKILQRDIAAKLDIAPATCQRILNGESSKLKESFYYSHCITELVGQLPFQLLGIDFENNPRLKLLDAITKLPDSEIISVANYIKLLKSEQADGKVVFSNLHTAEALAMISKLYHKIIKVNLTHDTFEPVDVYQKEWLTEEEQNKNHRLSEWLANFASSNLIHPDDRKTFSDYANLPCLRQIMRFTDIDCSLEYRRKIHSDYRWVCMEILRSTEYTPDNQVIMLCIKDIENYHYVK